MDFKSFLFDIRRRLLCRLWSRLCYVYSRGQKEWYFIGQDAKLL